MFALAFSASSLFNWKNEKKKKCCFDFLFLSSHEKEEWNEEMFALFLSAEHYFLFQLNRFDLYFKYEFFPSFSLPAQDRYVLLHFFL